MLNVVVMQNGVPIGKEVYAGDTSNVKADLDQRSQADPTLSFNVYDDSTVAQFDAVKLTPQQTPDQTSYSALQLADDRIAFIAKRLGFI